jgi:hypothetical protein
MDRRDKCFFGVAALVLLSSAAANGADVGICSIVEKPASFNHQNVTMQGTALGVKETTSHRGNDYTTSKLMTTVEHALIQDSAYENLLKSPRQVLHRRVAGVLRGNAVTAG